MSGYDDPKCEACKKGYATTFVSWHEMPTALKQRMTKSGWICGSCHMTHFPEKRGGYGR